MSGIHFSGCLTPDSCWCEIKKCGIIAGIAAVIFVLEVVGGNISHSLSLHGDAGHVFTDIVANLVVITALLAEKFGYSKRRARTIGGYINATLLAAISVYIFVEAIDRYRNPQEILSTPMMIIAIIGAFGNVIQVSILKAMKASDLLLDSLYKHAKSDLYMSLAVIFSGAIIWLTGFTLADTISSIAISIAIMYWSMGLFKNLRSGHYAESDSACGHDH